MLLNDFVTDVTEGAARIAKDGGKNVLSQDEVNAYLRRSCGGLWRVGNALDIMI